MATLTRFTPGRSFTPNYVVFRAHGSGFDIIFHAVGQARKQKLVPVAVLFRLHRRLLPLQRAVILRVQSDGLRREIG